MVNAFYSFQEVLQKLNISNRQEKRKLLKLIKSGKFTIYAKNPTTGKILPYKITSLDLETEKMTGYFLDS